MSVRGKVVITNPESVDVTLQVTMTVKEWRAVMQQLKDTKQYETTRLYWLMYKAVSKAVDVIAEEIEEAPEIR